MSSRLLGVRKVFLTPCAATKPIYASPVHRNIYQKFAARFGYDATPLVVSEPVVLIHYQDLYDLEDAFRYDFPPRLLGGAARALFVERLHKLLSGRRIVGCLPRHHASLINDAVGTNWKNYWNGDLYSMVKKASLLRV